MKDEARRAGLCRLGSLLGVLFLAACGSDGTEPLPPETAEVGVVLGSVDLSLIPSTSGVGFDEAGRLYTLTPGFCDSPGTANRHDGAYEVEITISVGICPVAIAFTTIEEEN